MIRGYIMGKNTVTRAILIFCIMWFVVGIGILEISAAEKTGTTSDGFSYKISKDNTVQITKYKGKKKKLEFPDKIKGKKVTKIGKAAVKGNKYVTSINVPDSVKTVELDSFDDCRNLTRIKFGKNLKEIGENSYVGHGSGMVLNKKFQKFEVSVLNKHFFSKDGALFERNIYTKEVYLLKCPPAKKGEYSVPEGVTDVEIFAFHNSQLSAVIFPSTMESAGLESDKAFCSNIAEYKVDEANEKFYAEDGVLFKKDYGKYVYPKGHKLIHYPSEKRDAFYQVPQGVIVVVREAFREHSYLCEIEIPDAIYIEKKAFQGCKKLKKAVLSGEPCEYSFAGCKKLKEVELKDVKEIHECAFEESGLERIILPESVKKVENWAFKDCDSLKWVEFRNKDCDIRTYGPIGITNKTVIYGYPDSTAEKFAQERGQEFRLIGEERPGEDYEGTITRDTIKLSQTSYIYDGKEKRPKVTVKDKFGNKIREYRYKVTYKNNKNVGVATVKIQFLKEVEYTGTIQTTFVIIPPKSRITKLASGKNDITLQWSGVKPSQITGYEIQYSTGDKFEKENTQTVQVNKRDAAKKQIKNLDSKKTYYVRIRSYKNIKREGKPQRLYSKWSDKKKVKTL